MSNVLQLLGTVFLLAVISLPVLGVEEERPQPSVIYTHSFCAELKSLELRISSEDVWGVAQVYNEVAVGSPISLVTDHVAIQLLIDYLPFTQVRMIGEDKRSYWNSTMENGKYLVCVTAERDDDKMWGGRIVPSYNKVHQLRLIYKGDTIFTYGAMPEESILNI